VAGSLSLRAGYAFYGSPYKDEMNNVADYVGNRYSLSGGAGFRSGDFFLDLAYVQSHEKGNTFIYDDASDAYSNIVANTEMINNRFMMTMGFKF
jgi:outer membrane protease